MSVHTAEQVQIAGRLREIAIKFSTAISETVPDDADTLEVFCALGLYLNSLLNAAYPDQLDRLQYAREWCEMLLSNIERPETEH